jgi:hypothetical protein
LDSPSAGDIAKHYLHLFVKGLLGLLGATHFRRKEKCNLSGAKLQLICVSKAFSAPIFCSRYWIVDEERRKMRKAC